MGLPDTYYAARGLGARDSLIAILFSGKTKQKRRLIDVYETGSGAYRYSSALPNEAADLTWTGDVFLLLDRKSLYPGLVAVRPRVSAPK